MLLNLCLEFESFMDINWFVKEKENLENMQDLIKLISRTSKRGIHKRVDKRVIVHERDKKRKGFFSFYSYLLC